MALVPVSGQVLANGSLNGKYFVRHVQFTTGATNAVTDARSILGAMTFDGAGHYAFTGQQASPSGLGTAFVVQGTYAVTAGGNVSLTNPQNTAVNINARFGTEALIGSSTEVSGNTFDIFVAIPAPTGGVTSANLAAHWFAADFELAGGSPTFVRSSMISMPLDAAGNMGAAGVNGHAATVNNGVPVNQTMVGGTYSINADGTGNINFPLPAGVTNANAIVVAGQRTLYLSQSGNILLGATAGANDLLIAIRSGSTVPTLNSGERFWNAGIRFDSNGAAASYAGSTTVIAADSSVVRTQRLHETGAGPLNVTSALLYLLASDGSGSIGPAKSAVEPVNSSSANMVTASNGNELDPTGYEISLGIPIPAVGGSGIFLNPQGIVNAASNAPAGDAISPGEFIALYGSGFASSTATAQALPFPKTLGGVSVSINGVNAPIYFVSAGQIDCIVPYGVTGTTATITVSNGAAASNTVSVLLAPTSPGVFSVDTSGTGDGAITHANGTLVNAANPAKKGETVVMYVSGLGALTNAVSDGFGATGINNATTPLAVYVAGVQVPASGIAYQGLTVDAGLYQINFAIPTTLTVSGELPVAILTPDAFTDEVNIAVQ